jgi:NADH-quinone oxidoreductase subunit L
LEFHSWKFILNFRLCYFKTAIAGATNLDMYWLAAALFIGACGKSAQPLYTWLPDAMAGPTPVSALIHAATMVTANFMITRLNFYLI